MDQEQRIEVIEAGQRAVGLLGLVRQPIYEAKEVIQKRLVSLYRARSASHDDLVGGIAEISALDALISNLESQITKGNVATRKEFDNAR